MNEMEREYHEVANIFPLMDGEEYEDLKADIAKHGLLEPIWLHEDGRIIDGRNRHRACVDLDIPFSWRLYEGDDGELVKFVLSLNLVRRHLNESQRAMVAARVANMPVGANQYGSANWPTHDGISQGDAAAALSVGDRSVRRAKKVIEEGTPELVNAVDTGQVSVSAAAEVATLPPEEQQAIMAVGPKEIQKAAKQEKEKRRKKKAEPLPQELTPPSLADELAGLPDQERFERLGWGLRTWDDWRFDKCDERFGDDWPGRIPAQLVAHTLFYFTREGDRVLDPMAGGGVVPDVCKVFRRPCDAFDLATRPERSEIRKHEWRLDEMTWPEMDASPNLIFIDPPYFTKMAADYAGKAADGETPISSLTRQSYLKFFDQFFGLARDNVEAGTRFAFLNADWRDFQGKPALEEDPLAAITMLNYAYLLNRNNWQVTHLIDAPMSTERFNAGVVSAMQKKRIMGVVRRTLIMAVAV